MQPDDILRSTEWSRKSYIQSIQLENPAVHSYRDFPGPSHRSEGQIVVEKQLLEADSKELVIHPPENTDLYAINRLDIAVDHVLGPHVRVETHAISGYMFLHWVARLNEEQVAKVMEIDGVSDRPEPYLLPSMLTNAADRGSRGRYRVAR